VNNSINDYCILNYGMLPKYSNKIDRFFKNDNCAASFNGRKFYIDDTYFYFFSKVIMNYEYRNVGKIEDRLRMYRIPLTDNLYEKFKNCNSVEDLTRFYENPKIPSYDQAKTIREVFSKGITEYFNERLKYHEKMENYESCIEIRDLLTLRSLDKEMLTLPTELLEKWN